MARASLVRECRPIRSECTRTWSSPGRYTSVLRSTTLIPAITVLLVEDDFLIMEMLKEALEEGGLAIETAITAEQAIEVLEAGVADCRALITDVNLPGRLLGWDVARRGREINDELPADSHR